MSEFCSQGYEDYYVAFIDILGFSNLAKCSEKDYELFQSILKVLRAFKWLESPRVEPPQGSYSYAFADSITMFTPLTQRGLPWILGLASNICARLLTFEGGFLTRGGIVKGKLYCEELESGRLVFGEGLIDAYKLENEVADYPRVIVNSEVYRCFQELNGWPFEYGVYKGSIGEARWNGKGNVERSTIFLVPIRQNCIIQPMDDIDGVFVPVESEAVDWNVLRRNFVQNEQYACTDREKAKKAGCERNREKWQFADGAARILQDEKLF